MVRSSRPLFWLAALGCAVAVIVLSLISTGGLQQDDYYHLRMAQLLAAGDAPSALIWAKHTVLAERFADLHFGFHVWLVPFVWLLGPVSAGKAASVLLAGVALALAAFSARSRSAVNALLPLLIVFASTAFTLRLLAVRPLALTLAALILVLVLAESRRFFWIAPVAALLTLSHAAFPLLLLPAGAQAAALLISTKRCEWRGVAAVVLGITSGLLLHPDRAALLPMLTVQLLHVGASSEVTNTEWAAPGLRLIAAEVGPLLAALCAVFAAVVVATVRTRQPPPERVLSWCLMSAASFALYLGYHRGIDLFVPSACVCICVAWSWFQPLWPLYVRVLLGVAVLALGVVHVDEARVVYRELAKIDLRSSARWLERNTPAGSEVFIGDYASFPQLFFLNRHNVYTLAFDPAFMEARDPALYRAWVDAVTLRGDPYFVIHERFGAAFVLVENTPNGRPFYERLLSDPSRFAVRYQDSYATVFETVRH